MCTNRPKRNYYAGQSELAEQMCESQMYAIPFTVHRSISIGANQSSSSSKYTYSILKKKRESGTRPFGSPTSTFTFVSWFRSWRIHLNTSQSFGQTLILLPDCQRTRASRCVCLSAYVCMVRTVALRFSESHLYQFSMVVFTLKRWFWISFCGRPHVTSSTFFPFAKHPSRSPRWAMHIYMLNADRWV